MSMFRRVLVGGTRSLWGTFIDVWTAFFPVILILIPIAIGVYMDEVHQAGDWTIFVTVIVILFAEWWGYEIWSSYRTIKKRSKYGL